MTESPKSLTGQGKPSFSDLDGVSRQKLDQGMVLSTKFREKRRQQRQDTFMELIRAGRTIKAACAEIGISEQGYRDWRRRFPDWRTELDRVRQGGETFNPQWTSGFVPFRLKYFKYETYWHQLQIIDAIEHAKPMSVTAILVPPEHGKTTVMEDYICQLLGTDPNRRIAYISESMGLARKICGRLKKRMTDIRMAGEYVAHFGPFYGDGQERQGKPWSADYFTLYKADHDERDYSFEARGAKSSIQGSRVDDLFLDDIQSLKSLNLTDQIVERFQQEWLTRVGKNGRTIIVGTRVGVGDIYDVMKDRGLIDTLVQLPAMNDDGEPLCPELWPKESLEKRRRQVGEEIWLRTYQQRPRQAGNVTFTQEITDGAKDLGRIIEPAAPGRAVLMSLDPALGGGCSFTVASYDANHFQIIDQLTERNYTRTEEILDATEAMASKYRPSDFVIEMMAFQKAIGLDDRMNALGKKYGFRVYPHETGDNKHDPIFGVANMAGSLRMQEMTIPWGDQNSRERMQPLLDELEMWRPGVGGKKLRQDRVMSLWFGWLFWQERKQALLSDSFTTGRKGLPWKPLRFSMTGRR